MFQANALVTGCSAGIGEAIAWLLAAEGARVMIHGETVNVLTLSPTISRRRAAMGRSCWAGDLSTDTEADAQDKIKMDGSH